MAQSYKVTFCKERAEIGVYGRVILSLIVLALISYTFCYELHPFVDYLYLTLSPRSFTPILYGVFSIVNYTLIAISLVTALPFVYHLFRETGTFAVNTGVVAFGMATLSLAFLTMAAANDQSVIFLALPLDMFNSWPYAGMRIMIANLVPSNEVGMMINRFVGVVGRSLESWRRQPTFFGVLTLITCHSGLERGECLCG